MEDDNGKQYSLRWEKHAYNLASEAGCFFEDESFLDCTLSAEGQCIEAHKIILSAASSYLSNLLKIMPDKHPILIFNDIKFEQLKALVAFIYNGSVNVSENNIHAFLNAAQSLLIKGLSEECKEDERTPENLKRVQRNIEPLDARTMCRKSINKPLVLRKPDVPIDAARLLKKPRQFLTKPDGSYYGECEENLSKLQEISITKYLHQNIKSPARNDTLENKRNGPVDDKLKISENYVVKSWKHNSVEDLNGRLRQNKNNGIKKIKLEKPIAHTIEETRVDERKKCFSEQTDISGNGINRLSSEETDEKIKKNSDEEEMVMVEPKQEIIEEDDTNADGFNSHISSHDVGSFESESMYENKSSASFSPIVDRGVPVPLLMCRTSLSEPDTDPNWIPPVTPNIPPEHPPHLNSVDNNAQDLKCRSCAQDLCRSCALPCPTCTKKYKSRYALNRHILYECGKARKSFSCDECGKKVTRQDTLQKHKLIHLVQHLKKKESEGNEEPFEEISQKRKKKEEKPADSLPTNSKPNINND